MLQADVQFRPDTSCTPSSSKEKQLWDALLLSEHKSSETFTEEYHKDNYWGINYHHPNAWYTVTKYKCCGRTREHPCDKRLATREEANRKLNRDYMGFALDCFLHWNT